MGRIVGFRSIFLGSSFTLLATVFTVSVIDIWLYILIISFIIGLLIGLLVIEYKTDVKIGKIDHYCNYIQVLIRENLLDDPKTKKFKESQLFLPLSFYISTVKDKNSSIKTSLNEFNQVTLDQFIVEPVVSESESIKDWLLKSERIKLFRFTILTITVLIALVISVVSIGQPINIGWFDIDTFSQIPTGVSLFLFLSMFYVFPKYHKKTPIFSLLFVFILTSISVVLWEVMSNTFLVSVGIGQIDSPQNMATDILFGLLGGGIAWIFALEFFEEKRDLWKYYIFTMIFFGITLAIHVTLRLF